MELAAVADLLRTNELLVSRLYLECARLFPEYGVEFSVLAREEEFHASVLTDIIREISADPGLWRLGKISGQTILLLQSNLKQALEDLITGKVAPRYGITVLRSFELGMSERMVGNVLINENPEALKQLSIIDNGFSDHLKRLQDLEKRIFGNNEFADQFHF